MSEGRVGGRLGAPALVLVPAVLATVTGCAAHGVGATIPNAAPTTAATTVAAPSPPPAPAVAALLRERSAAVLAADGTRLAATISPAASGAQRAAQLLPLAAPATGSRLTFTRYALTIPPAATPPAAGSWDVAASLTYALPGDNGGVSVPRRLTLDRTARGWLVRSETGDDVPWDFGPVASRTGRSATVYFHPAAAALAATVAREADVAVPVVTAAWGTGWARRTVVVVPATTREFQGLLGTTADVAGLAAAQSVEVGGGTGGDRILVNPPVFADRTSARGQQVIVTHEVTHVASAAATTATVPLWLVEGFADEVAFGSTSLTPRQAAPELTGWLQDHAVPTALPDDAAFQPSSAGVILAYQEAWLAVRLLVHGGGTAAVVHLYESLGRGATLAAALAATVHTTPAHVLAAWRAELAALR